MKLLLLLLLLLLLFMLLLLLLLLVILILSPLLLLQSPGDRHKHGDPRDTTNILTVGLLALSLLLLQPRHSDEEVVVL